MNKPVILAVLLFCLVQQGLSCAGGGGGGKKSEATTAAPEQKETDTKDPDLSDPANESSDPESCKISSSSETNQTCSDTLPKKVCTKVCTLRSACVNYAYNDPDADANNGDGIDFPEDLACKGSDETCCWTNEKDNDDLDYRKGTGVKPEVAAYAESNGAPIPDDVVSGESPYFFAGAPPTTATEQEAWYKSCSVNCMDPTITVTAKALMSVGVELEACLLDKDSSGPLSDCALFGAPSSNGDATATIYADETQYDRHIVIVARGYSNGGVAAIDDIRVDFTKDECAESTTPEATTEAFDSTVGSSTGTGEETTTDSLGVTDYPEGTDGTESPGGEDADLEACKAAGCGPSDEECTGYKSNGALPGGEAPLAGNEWKTRGTTDEDEDLTNPATGVNDLKEPFLATYLFGGESSITASEEFELAEDRVLHFQRLERTNKAQLKLCLDEQAIECVYESNDKTTIDDYTWTKETVTLKKGTKKLYWIFDNQGENQGVAALRRINFAKEDGEKVCPPPSIPEKKRRQLLRKARKNRNKGRN